MSTKAPQFSAGQLNVYPTPHAVADVSRALRHTGRRVMLVPTMGALHEGHLALVRAAKRVPGAVVVVSIFVNPLQFGAGEDLDAYPRTLDADLEMLRDEGVEVAFTPTPSAMYPDGPRTTVHPGPLGAELEGSSRPTHFAGMLTVVLKLLQIIRPDRAFFGEKDYQQLQVIRRLAGDLDLPVEIIGSAIIRDHDGLALSSRNAYLTQAERGVAPALYKTLVQAARALAGGANVSETEAASILSLTQAGFESVDYFEVRDPESLTRMGPGPVDRPARILATARLGKTRLLDNVEVRSPGAQVA